MLQPVTCTWNGDASRALPETQQDMHALLPWHLPVCQQALME